MERFKIFTGENLSIQKYLETWRLDNMLFEEKDKISKKTALEWFEYSNRSTIVLWNMEKDCLIGYITPFLMKHDFASKYLISEKTYKEALKKNSFAKPSSDVSADIYIFSTVVVDEYRDTIMTSDTSSVFYGKSAFKVLNEALVDWVCYIKRKRGFN